MTMINLSFSTTLTLASSPLAIISAPKADTTDGTPLQTGFSFFYMRRGKAAKSENKNKQHLPQIDDDADPTTAEGNDKSSGVKPSYFDAVKSIGTVHTVEQFWTLYNHLVRPNNLPTTTDYHFFREGIEPTWEDPSNARGGKWIVRLKKGLASRYWEELLLALLGGQLSGGGVSPDEICGAVISIRYNEDIVSVWNKSAGNREVVDKVRDGIKRVLHLPSGVHMEYKPHQDSLADRSSFRNTTVWRGGRGGGGEGREGRSEGRSGEERGRRSGSGRGDHGEEQGPPRRSGSWGERDEIRGGAKPKGRTEVERAWR